MEERDERRGGEALRAALAAVEGLGPEGGLVGSLDTAGLGRALIRLGPALLRRPGPLTRAGVRCARDASAAALATVARAAGRRAEGPVAPEPGDRRFADPAWEGNAWFYGLLQAYLLWSRLMSELVAAAGLEGTEGKRAEFAMRAVVDALAPTNTLAGNPKALRKAFDTGGLSLLQGLRNFAEDLVHNQGMPRQVDTKPFRVGGNLATTPGAVVYRNELMELIQYEPQTKTTYKVPLLLSPPWINKYYIMDLAPGRSFAEWAVNHGHTTFAISYRNPDVSMRDVALDDYLVHGPRAALDVIADVTGQDQANIVGLCLGGTLTTMLLAVLAGTGEDRVRSATLLNTLVDFSEPGALGTFTDPGAVEHLSKKIARRGYLEAKEMSSTFDLLRANDLIWNYVGSNWLMGESPPAFDLLAWNSDSTRMPAAMYSFYLSSCYVENRLARGEMELVGRRLDLGDIGAEVYVLAAKEDHIAPWTSSYRTTQLLKRVSFVLSSSGHIAGIVNPPSPKARHWTNEALPPDPQVWLDGAACHEASWWEDWADWIGERSGEQRKPPSVGSRRHPPLAPAPGDYVHEK